MSVLWLGKSRIIHSFLSLSLSLSHTHTHTHTHTSSFNVLPPPPIHSIEGVHRILVATSEGVLYVGNIDPRDGGECRITKEFRLLGSDGYVPDDGHKLLAAVSATEYIHVAMYMYM